MLLPHQMPSRHQFREVRSIHGHDNDTAGRVPLDIEVPPGELWLLQRLHVEGVDLGLLAGADAMVLVNPTSAGVTAEYTRDRFPMTKAMVISIGTGRWYATRDYTNPIILNGGDRVQVLAGVQLPRATMQVAIYRQL